MAVKWRLVNEPLFANLRHARELIAARRDAYNHHRPIRSDFESRFTLKPMPVTAYK